MKVQGLGQFLALMEDSLPFQQLPHFVKNDMAHYYLCILRPGGKVQRIFLPVQETPEMWV